MYFYLCLCGALLITMANSEISTLPATHPNKTNKTDGHKTDLINKTNLILVSEGGKLSPNTPDLSSPKDNLNSLLTLDEELSKTKENAVVPRKGVDLKADEKNSTHSETKGGILMQETTNTNTKRPPVVLNGTTNTHGKPALSNDISTTPKLNTTVVHKKPTILSYEGLANMEKRIQSSQSKIPLASSTQTMDSSQIPSPNHDSLKKVYPSKANNSHPGMIMPIVITILVVPMFAIVGYFALKRGQEAWKNRHYKRMDFLLDGMYND